MTGALAPISYLVVNIFLYNYETDQLTSLLSSLCSFLVSARSPELSVSSASVGSGTTRAGSFSVPSATTHSGKTTSLSTRAQCYTTSYGRNFANVHNKLECLSLSSLPA